nr:SDR family NAD(P)-dependent oxidoreductase [Solirubrobacterales bacterium]
MNDDFEGRTALVTGAARGLGLAIARELDERGATVVLADIDEPAVRG